MGIAVVAVVVAGTGEVFSGKESAVGNGKLKDERSESNRVSVVSFECSRSSGPASGFRIIRPILLAALDAFVLVSDMLLDRLMAGGAFCKMGLGSTSFNFAASIAALATR